MSNQVRVNHSVDDPLYERVKRIVAKSREVGVLQLKRKLCIGHGRAHGLLEAMANEGIVERRNTERGPMYVWPEAVENNVKGSE